MQARIAKSHLDEFQEEVVKRRKVLLRLGHITEDGLLTVKGKAAAEVCAFESDALAYNRLCTCTCTLHVALPFTESKACLVAMKRSWQHAILSSHVSSTHRSCCTAHCCSTMQYVGPCLQIDTADELMTTELMFNAVWQQLKTPAALVALLSCLVPCKEKERSTDTEVALPLELATTYAIMQDFAESLAKISNVRVSASSRQSICTCVAQQGCRLCHGVAALAMAVPFQSVAKSMLRRAIHCAHSMRCT